MINFAKTSTTAKMGKAHHRLVDRARRGCLFAFFTVLLASCSHSPPPSKTTAVDKIPGRYQEQSNQPLYRVKTPTNWIRRLPLPEESLVDTTKSIADFFIYDDDQMIRIAIHNFSTETIEERIPPNAQVARWQTQFSSLDPEQTNVIPQAFSGFVGLRLTATGTLDEKEMTVIAWSLQLAPEHYQTLTLKESSHPERRADVTIKAAGPVTMMRRHDKDIIAFARSFELIEEIPSP